MLIFVITLSLVAEYNSEIIIDDSEIGESSDIIVSANSESKNYYQDAYQNDIFAEIINIVESNSKSKIKQIKQVETLSGTMQEQRRNNSLEAVIDQRELLSKVFVVDEIVWSSINFVNKSDKSLIYSNKNDNIRMINDTIFLNVVDNFRFNFTSRISEKSIWSVTEEFIENMGFKLSSESILIIEEIFFEQQLFSNTSKSSFELEVFWILLFDYSNFDFSTIDSQNQYANRMNNLIFINLLDEEIYNNIQIEFAYLDKLENFGETIFLNIQFIIIILNLIFLVISSFIIAEYNSIYGDFKIFTEKIKNLKNKNINLNNFDLIVFLSFAAISTLVLLSLLGIYIAIAHTLKINLIVSINIFVISFFLLILNVSLFYISSKQKNEEYKNIFFFTSLQFLVFILREQNANYSFW